MTDLIHKSSSLADRVQRSIAARRNGAAVERAPRPQTLRKALLLDISGSMLGGTDTPGLSRIAALRKLVKDLGLSDTQAIYAFSDSAYKCSALEIPQPDAGTFMGKAFKRLKKDGYHAAVLITDGGASDPDEALKEMNGLALEIIYVGPVPNKPEFLDKLAKVGGSEYARQGLLGRDQQKLTDTVKGLLA